MRKYEITVTIIGKMQAPPIHNLFSYRVGRALVVFETRYLRTFRIASPGRWARRTRGTKLRCCAVG